MKKLIYLLIILSSLYSCKKEDKNPAIPHSNFNQKILEGYYIRAIAFDNFGNSWIGTYKNGIIKYNSNETIIYNSSNSNLPDSILIWDMAVDHKDNVWIGTSDNGLIKFDGNSFISYNSSNSSVPTNNVFSIAIDSKDNIWFSSFYGDLGGMVMYDGTSWNIYTPDNSILPDSRVHSITIDQNDNVWASLNKHAGNPYLIEISNSKWTLYTKDEIGFIPIWYSDIQINSKNELCVALDYTLSSLYPHKGPRVFMFDGETSEIILYDSTFSITSLTIDNNDNIWGVESFGGYSIYNGQIWIRDYIGDRAHTIKQAKNDKIWIGTDNGIYISD